MIYLVLEYGYTSMHSEHGYSGKNTAQARYQDLSGWNIQDPPYTEIRFKTRQVFLSSIGQVVMSLTPSKAPASFVTPTKRAALVSGADAGPSRARPQGASPAYVRPRAADFSGLS